MPPFHSMKLKWQYCLRHILHNNVDIFISQKKKYMYCLYLSVNLISKPCDTLYMEFLVFYTLTTESAIGYVSWTVWAELCSWQVLGYLSVLFGYCWECTRSIEYPQRRWSGSMELDLNELNIVHWIVRKQESSRIMLCSQ